MSSIKIDSTGTKAVVTIDGVKIGCLTSIDVSLAAGRAPEVRASMFLHQQEIDLTGAVLKIDGVDMPQSVEEALLHYLCNKYPLQSMVARQSGTRSKTSHERFLDMI